MSQNPGIVPVTGMTSSEAFLPNPPLETRRARRERLLALDEDEDLDFGAVVAISPYAERPRLSLVGSERSLRAPRY